MFIQRRTAMAARPIAESVAASVMTHACNGSSSAASAVPRPLPRILPTATASHPSNCRCIGRAALQAPPLAVFEEQVVALPVLFTRDWTMKGRGSEDEERSQGTLIDSTFRTKNEDSNIRDMQKLRFVQHVGMKGRSQGPLIYSTSRTKKEDMNIPEM